MEAMSADPFAIPLPELRRRTSKKWSVVSGDQLPLWVAEMDVRLAPAITERLHEMVELSDTGYPGTHRDFADAFASFADRHWSWHVDPAQCRVFPDLGASGGALLRQFAGQDGRVLVTTPMYNAFFDWVQRAGLTCEDAPSCPDTGAPNLEAIERAFADGVRVMLLGNPQNPIGRTWRRSELEQLAALADHHGAVVVADEIHAPLVHPDAQFIPFLTVSDAARRVGVCITSASKGWNLAGLKASLLVKDEMGPDLPAALDGGNDAGHLGVVAGAIAFSPACDQWIETVRTLLAERTRRIAARLREEIPGVRVRDPEAGYLLWLDFTDVPGLWDSAPSAAAPAGSDGELTAAYAGAAARAIVGDAAPAAPQAEASLADILLERAGVLCSPGESYAPGSTRFARLNAGTSDAVLDEAVDRIVRAVSAIHAGKEPAR